MKHLIPLSIIILVLQACTLSGTRSTSSPAINRNADRPAGETSAVTLDSVEINDTLRIDSSGLVSALKIVYPVTPSLLADSVLQWIRSSLSPDTLSGSSQNIGSASQLASGIIARERSDVRTDFPTMTSGAMFDFVANSSPVCIAPQFTSYQTSVYRYRGGAHGRMYCINEIFVNSTGARLGWNIFRAEALPDVLTLVSGGILNQYFDGDTEMMAQSMLLETDRIPLPSQPPLFTPDGITFIYQQYEITVYAAGMPHCTVPYADLKPFMTASALELLDF